jgi:hypothetical protein
MSKVLMAVSLTLGIATTASAQDGPARFTVGAGAGISMPFHGDLDFTRRAGRSRRAERRRAI